MYNHAEPPTQDEKPEDTPAAPVDAEMADAEKSSEKPKEKDAETKVIYKNKADECYKYLYEKVDCDGSKKDIITKEHGGELESGHVFHNQCIHSWIKHDKHSCPNCRKHFDHHQYVF